MNATRPIFGKAKLRFAEVYYRCDLTRKDGKVVPLGVMADVCVQGWYGLALKARKSVSEEEMSFIGGLAKPLIAKPFEYLRVEFDRIFDSDTRVEEFGNLSLVHSSSLYAMVQDYGEFALPHSIATAEADAVRDYLRDNVMSTANTAYWNLLVKCDHPAPGADVSDASRLAA